jgi:hypothetical protein
MCKIPIVSTPELCQGFDLLAICTKIREVSGASAAHPRVIISVRAVAQLGRAPGSGQAPNEYAHLLSHALTSFFIGKLVERALSQVFSNEIKKCRPCTKKWTKRPTRGPLKNPRLESSDTCGGPAFLLRKQLMSHILAIECIAYFLKSAALPKFSFCLIRI